MSENPSVSIVIPAYKCESTLGNCLNAINSMTNPCFECIVVLDGPNDALKEIVSKSNHKFIVLDRNFGPAYARNQGAQIAQGRFLFFLDSDVILQPDAIDVIKNQFEDHNVNVLQGVYNKYPANPRFITKFAALKKWVDYKPEITKFFTTVSSGIFVIRRQIFIELKGFNEQYRSNTVEDYEFGHRIAQKYPIHLCPQLLGKHFYPSHSQLLKNYFRRSKEWSGLFLQRKKFDTGVANSKSGLSMIFSGILLFSILMMILNLIFHIECLTEISISCLFSSILLIILLNFSFLKNISHEYGIGFVIMSYFILLELNIMLLFGSVIGILSFPVQQNKNLI